MTSFKVFWRTGIHDGEFFFLFLNLSAVPTNSVPSQFGHIRQVKRVGIIAKKNKRSENHNFNAVSFALPSSLLKVPNVLVRTGKGSLEHRPFLVADACIL